jgi:hypothetical protein
MAAPTTEMPPELLASLQYQQENIDDDRTSVLIGVCWFLLTLAIVAVGLRFYAERMLRNSFKLQDGLIILGLVRPALWKYLHRADGRVRSSPQDCVFAPPLAHACL